MSPPPALPSSRYLLSDPRPWAFSRSELTAGLRRHTGDSNLQVQEIEDYDLPQQRPSIGRIRGLKVSCHGRKGDYTFKLVLKEPQGTTRTGTAGVGLREVSVYRHLMDQLPVQTPQLMAAHPLGEWLILDLLPLGKEPARWTADDYRLALDQMIALHDRFWNLGEDLTIYNWLARPLDADFEIYVEAAANGVKRLVDSSPTHLLGRDPALSQMIGRLVLRADEIAAALSVTPATLIHGDFWPGNILIQKNENLILYDWQHTGISPPVLELVTFVQASRWWFDPLPLSPQDIIHHYRAGLSRVNGYTWDDAEWAALWDHGLMWIFLAHWIDLVAATPESLIETRFGQFERVWLKPLREAAKRLQL